MTISGHVKTLDDSKLLAELRALARRSHELEAELLEHLAEVDERRLYLPDHTSLFAFCMAELGFSESSTAHRVTVARLVGRFPRVIDLLRAGKVHLSGLRVLAAHLTPETADALLDQAIGQSTRAIEELVAQHAPRPAVAESIRKVPTPRPAATAAAAPVAEAPAPLFASARISPARPPVVAPLAPDRYHVQFTANRALRDKIETAKALLRHQNPSGDLATILDRALTLLLAQVKKQRWGVGRKPRSSTPPQGRPGSRHVPDPIRRAVYERDGGQCTFVDTKGQRCAERGWLEIDHVEGFARRKEHTLAGLRLACRAHNQYAAERMYGAELMRRKRRRSGPEPTTT